MFYEKIQTPAYILEEDKLRKNCELLASVGEKSGAKVLLALKGFAFSGKQEYNNKSLRAFPLMRRNPGTNTRLSGKCTPIG